MPVGSERMGIIPTKSAGPKRTISALCRLNTATFPLFCRATKANLSSGDVTTWSGPCAPGAASEPSGAVQPRLQLADPEHRYPVAPRDQQVLLVMGERLACGVGGGNRLDGGGRERGRVHDHQREALAQRHKAEVVAGHDHIERFPAHLGERGMDVVAAAPCARPPWCIPAAAARGRWCRCACGRLPPPPQQQVRPAGPEQHNARGHGGGKPAPGPAAGRHRRGPPWRLGHRRPRRLPAGTVQLIEVPHRIGEPRPGRSHALDAAGLGGRSAAGRSGPGRADGGLPGLRHAGRGHAGLGRAGRGDARRCRAGRGRTGFCRAGGGHPRVGHARSGRAGAARARVGRAGPGGWPPAAPAAAAAPARPLVRPHRPGPAAPGATAGAGSSGREAEGPAQGRGELAAGPVTVARRLGERLGHDLVGAVGSSGRRPVPGRRVRQLGPHDRQGPRRAGTAAPPVSSSNAEQASAYSSARPSTGLPSICSGAT